MNDSKPSANLGRRGFLVAGSIGSVGAVAAVVAPKAAKVPVAPKTTVGTDERYVSGERATRYYDTTRV
ncbi:MAG: hypothetical protein EAZ24_04815 [Burkholderiales bacterium]|nr:MAG: hypothetical protein EAZ24_04815 [Burkholderiales bacterium]